MSTHGTLVAGSIIIYIYIIYNIALVGGSLIFRMTGDDHNSVQGIYTGICTRLKGPVQLACLPIYIYIGV